MIHVCHLAFHQAIPASVLHKPMARVVWPATIPAMAAQMIQHQDTRTAHPQLIGLRLEHLVHVIEGSMM